MITAEELAKEIRRHIGMHALGTDDLAEALLPFIQSRAAGVQGVMSAWVGDMKTSAGMDYYVCVGHGKAFDEYLTPNIYKIRGRAECDVACWNHLFGNCDKPDILAFDTGDPTAATQPPNTIRVDVEQIGSCELDVRDGVAYMPAVTVQDIVSKSCLKAQPPKDAGAVPMPDDIAELASDEGPLACAELHLRMTTLGCPDVDDGSLAEGLRDARRDLKAYGDAREAAASVTWSAEDACEAFIAAEVDAAPEALRRLGEWLNQRMDEDDAKTASRMVIGAMMETSAAIRAVGEAAARADAAPDGYVLMPRTPTNKITSAMACASEDPENERSSWDLAENMYRAAIEAMEPAARAQVAEYQVRPRAAKSDDSWRRVSKREFDDYAELPGFPDRDYERRKLFAHPSPAHAGAGAEALAVISAARDVARRAGPDREHPLHAALAEFDRRLAGGDHA